MRSVMKVAAATAIALTVIVALTAPPTSAQQGQGATGMAACRADIAAFCKGIEAGGGKRVQCLQANEARLQPDCAAAIDSRREAKGPRGAHAAPPVAPTGPQTGAPVPSASAPTAAVPAEATVRPMMACRADVKTLCASVPVGRGEKMKCLRENQAKLSPVCADAIAARQAERKDTRADVRAACKGDSRAFCKGSKGPERRACLTTNLAKLSPACSDVLGNAALAPGAQPKAQ